METITKSVIVSLILVCLLMILKVHINDLKEKRQNTNAPLFDNTKIMMLNKKTLDEEIDQRINLRNKATTKTVLLNTVNGAIRGTIIGTATTGTPTGAIVAAIVLGSLGGIETGMKNKK